MFRFNTQQHIDNEEQETARRLREAKRNARRNRRATTKGRRPNSLKTLFLRLSITLFSSCIGSVKKAETRTGDTPGSRRRVTFNVETDVFNYASRGLHCDDCDTRWCICVRELSTIRAHRLKYAIPEEESTVDERRVQEVWWRHRDESLEVEDVSIVGEGLDTLQEERDIAREELERRKAVDDYKNLSEIGKYIINEVTELSNDFDEAGELWTRDIMPRL